MESNNNQDQILPGYEINQALHILTIPYFGFYNYEAYELISPEKIIHIFNKKLIQYLPKRMGACVQNYLNVYPENDITFCSVNYDASKAYNPQNLCRRVNLILHPFIYSDAKQPIQDETRMGYASLYTLGDNDTTIFECKDEYDRLKINAANVLDPYTSFKIHVHEEIFMSPNNAAFMLRFTKPLVTFGLVVSYYKPMSDKPSLLVEWVNIITNNEYSSTNIMGEVRKIILGEMPLEIIELKLIDDKKDVKVDDSIPNKGISSTDQLYNKMDIFKPIEEKSSDSIWFKLPETAIHKFNFENINDIPKKETLIQLKEHIFNFNTSLIKEITKFLYSQINDIALSPKASPSIEKYTMILAKNFLNEPKLESEISNYYRDEFFHYIWLKFDQPQISSFGESFYYSLTPQLQLKLICAYFTEIIRYYYKFLYYFILFRLPEDTELIIELEGFVEKYAYRNTSEAKKHEFDPLIKLLILLSEPPAQEPMILAIILQCYMENMFSEGDYGIDKLNTKIQDYIYERTWTLKGRPTGISDNFGKYSFLNFPELAEEFYCLPEEKIKIMLDLMNNFETV